MLAVDNYFTSIKGIKIPILFECGPFVTWLIYPALGYYLRKKGTDYRLWPWIVVTIIGLIACIIETKLLYAPYNGGLGATKISAVVYSCGIIMVLFNNKTRRLYESLSGASINKALVYVGEISFGIYLIHKYFLDYLVEPLVEDMLLRTFTTLAMSVIFITIVKKIMPKFANKYLGFK